MFSPHNLLLRFRFHFCPFRIFVPALVAPRDAYDRLRDQSFLPPLFGGLTVGVYVSAAITASMSKRFDRAPPTYGNLPSCTHRLTVAGQTCRRLDNAIANSFVLIKSMF